MHPPTPPHHRKLQLYQLYLCAQTEVIHIMPINGNNLPIVFLLIISMASILQWNIRGFYSNCGDLLHILEDMEPVCMCIQESMLGDRVPRSPPGYSIETFSPTQQPTPGNGLVTIIRQAASYYCLNLNTPLQALAIRT